MLFTSWMHRICDRLVTSAQAANSRRRALNLLLFGALICVSTSSLAQSPQGDHDDHPHGPPGGLPLPHPKIHPPTGNVPAPGTRVVFDATGLGEPLALDKNWRLGIAPGTAPALPEFDDSGWPTRDAKDALAEVDEHAADDEDQPGHPTDAERAQHPHHGRPFAWFRIHVQLPENHGPLVVLVRLPVTRGTHLAIGSEAVGMDLFANGKLIVPEGPNGTTPESFTQISRIYPLDIPSDQTSVVLAARIPFVPFGLDAYTGFFAHRTFLIGEKEDLYSHLELWQHAIIFNRLPSLIENGLKLLLGFFLLALFWTQRDHHEYLWLGLHMLIVAPIAYLDILSSTAQLETFMAGALIVQLLLISAYFYFEFLVSFLSLRKRWYIIWLRYSAPLLLTWAPFLLLARQNKAAGIAFICSVLFIALWWLAWLLFVGLTLTIAAIKRNYEAALLLLPLLLSVVGLAELASTTAASSWVSGPIQSPLTFQAGPVPIQFSAVADFVGVFVIILIIFVRFQRIHRERERASNELAAARSVQELMIPRESPKTPGFHVDTVYTPASEVGGDFFHIQATGDGGLLIVIGDVAGHGLQAAMNVSLLMGALRRTPMTSPGQLLASLNEVLVGSSSFTTCEAAYFSANGELVIASAGHPPPFLNSQEVELPGGLPLGVITDVEYEETRLYLHPGDRLLMMSDGVSEARKSNGELFGFDRVRNLSNQSAFFIADAAKEFGQEDDITVLTVRRLAVAAAA